MKTLFAFSGLLALGAATVLAAANPFVGKHFYESPVYRKGIQAAIANLTARGEHELARKAAKVAKVSTFLWVAETAAVPSISTYLKDALDIERRTFQKQVVQFVVYNLPDRDCSAKASAGELSLADGGEEKYKAFIQSVAKELRKFPQITVVIQLETDAIGNLVTNLGVEKCANAAPAHKRLISYAIANLQLPNVSLYIDGAHAGWLGWEGNIQKAAALMGELLTAAKAINPKAKVRGVATNVSNYNGLNNGGEVGRDELKYITDLAPLLANVSFDAHFIIDQGRSGNQTAIRPGGEWCNYKYAGFGTRPTANTPSPLIDAIVWVKPGGESDGTSDESAERYDVACGSDSSLKPAPEAGTWFQAYFENLIVRASPAF